MTALLDLGGRSGLLLALLADLDAVVGLVPLTERGGIDLDDRVLDQGLGAHKLVVRGVVHDVEQTGLAGAS